MLRHRSLISISGKLPSQYQQVDFIQSTGTQYIDTRISLGQCNEWEIDFAITELQNETCLMGCTQGSLNYRLLTDKQGVYNNYYPELTVGTKYKAKITFTATSPYYPTTYSVNGSADYSAGNSETNPNTVALFASKYRNTVGVWGQSKVKIYRCIAKGVADFIPCYRKSDGEAGLYDTVNDVFYTNQGTGNFIVGQTIGGGIKTYLYNSGDECTALTGGWSSPNDAIGGSASNSNGYLDIVGTSGGNRPIMTNQMVNLSTYKYLFVTLEFTSSSGTKYVSIGESRSRNMANNTHLLYDAIPTSMVTCGFKIVGYTNKYVSVGVSNAGTMKVHNIWLEK